MSMLQLMNSEGELKFYKGFNTKPKVNDSIRVLYIPLTSSRPNRANAFKNVSLKKVYSVYRVVNDNQVLIKDDQGELAHLLQSEYQVVEELSDKEIKLQKQNNDMLLAINKMIKDK
ncbi:hypothetical protein AV656_06250 [Bhargavaea cecembensis]|uniref:Uncharacterized protein n=1 Tax=Bhargavaea cecembensis TaxID=394098 RepID=A0A165H1G0_9BACL|nr:hypothetical protein [Bhargavaea cecembensis]KZE38504.1 hypothetical protein AV656_06250 [Bhargavaea cecembensis]